MQLLRPLALYRQLTELVGFVEDCRILYSEGLFAAMCWDPKIDVEFQAIRQALNRRLSARYSPLQLLEENERDWRRDCERLAGDPDAVPFLWADLKERLKSTPNLLDHLLTKAHAPPTGASRL